MKKVYSNFIITLIFFFVITIIGMFVLPLFDKCRYLGMDCYYTYSFITTLEEALCLSAFLSLIFYVILRFFRKNGDR